MHEFWLKEKLLLIIGLFQFGLVLIAYAIVNFGKLILGKRDTSIPDSLNEMKYVAIAPSSLDEVKDAVSNPTDSETNNEINLSPLQPDLSGNLVATSPETIVAIDQVLPEGDLTSSVEVCKVEIAPDLLMELKEISNDPTSVIDEAIRWWLRRRTLDVLDSSPDRKYRAGIKSFGSSRSQKDLWND
jgi:hypothetical protein